MKKIIIITWHVALGFATLDPLAPLVPPVVLVGQNHVHVDVVVSRRLQSADVEAQEGEHPPEYTHKGKTVLFCLFVYLITLFPTYICIFFMFEEVQRYFT